MTGEPNKEEFQVAELLKTLVHAWHGCSEKHVWELFRDFFNMVDTNDDGQINSDEFRLLCRVLDLAKDLDEKTVAQLFVKEDTLINYASFIEVRFPGAVLRDPLDSQGGGQRGIMAVVAKAPAGG